MPQRLPRREFVEQSALTLGALGLILGGSSTAGRAADVSQEAQIADKAVAFMLTRREFELHRRFERRGTHRATFKVAT